MSRRAERPEHLLASAWAESAECPDPSIFLANVWDGLPTQERERVERHAERCPACAAERTLAQGFDDDAAAAGPPADDVSYVVSRLERLRFPREPARSVPTAERPAGAGRFLQDWRLWASAAVVVAALGAAVVLRPGPPPLPPPPGAGERVVRGAPLDGLQPIGRLETAPSELRWGRVAGAAEYVVRLLAVDDAVLWETRTATAAAALPPDVQQSLHGAVTYRWWVEAIDARQVRVAASETVAFEIEPDRGSFRD